MTSVIMPICGLDRVKLAEALPLDAPFTLFVFPTTFCNFKCSYCAHSLGSAKMKEQYGFEMQTMNVQTFKRVVLQAGKFQKKLKLLSLTGQGEPLLNKNLPLMTSLAKKSGVAERIEIITNAALLTHETGLALIESGLDCIRISLQGLSAAKYKQICGVDIGMAEFIDNIRWFYKHKKGCEVFVKVMDIALNPGEEEKFYSIFEDISDRMYIEQCRPVYSGVAYQNQDASKDRYGRAHEKRDVCPLCFYMLSVFPNGDVVPCDAIYKPVVLGNVNDDNFSFLNIWNGQALHDFRLLQLQKNRYENAGCRFCCAPDDVAHPEDALDDDAENLLCRFQTVPRIELSGDSDINFSGRNCK